MGLDFGILGNSEMETWVHLFYFWCSTLPNGIIPKLWGGNKCKKEVGSISMHWAIVNGNRESNLIEISWKEMG